MAKKTKAAKIKKQKRVAKAARPATPRPAAAAAAPARPAAPPSGYVTKTPQEMLAARKAESVLARTAATEYAAVAQDLKKIAVLASAMVIVLIIATFIVPQIVK